MKKPKKKPVKARTLIIEVRMEFLADEFLGIENVTYRTKSGYSVYAEIIKVTEQVAKRRGKK